ncbi:MULTISPECIES: hypothetical protein [unclassified Bradyrhizobium]|uniref:hypothetical protein n=1 Tax=Bradyrhizobium TaxID=374 RepID=UPI0028E6209B|nr:MULTISPECIES: hypothetical protein [unclassified Bradyrhizobium]
MPAVGDHSDLLLGAITVRDLALRKALKDVLVRLSIGVSQDEAALEPGELWEDLSRFVDALGAA